jgi:hypothetical protein
MILMHLFEYPTNFLDSKFKNLCDNNIDLICCRLVQLIQHDQGEKAKTDSHQVPEQRQRLSTFPALYDGTRRFNDEKCTCKHHIQLHIKSNFISTTWHD